MKQEKNINEDKQKSESSCGLEYAEVCYFYWLVAVVYYSLNRKDIILFEPSQKELYIK